MDRSAFKNLDLKVHAFLRNIPCIDVWTFHLEGGGKRSLTDFIGLWQDEPLRPNMAVTFLFAIRFALGKLFGWDKVDEEVPEDSYIHKLTTEEMAANHAKPGQLSIGPFRIVYRLENEALDETINKTVHAFSSLSMHPKGNDYAVYWAIYVKKTTFFTPIYMAIIKPFRHLIVYPAIIKNLEQRWIKTYGK